MIALPALVSFIPAVVAIIISPGPDTVYTLTRSLASGRTAGVLAGLGTATGVLVHTAAAVLGLTALLRASPLAYTAVAYLGAAYLVYLGVRTARRDEQLGVERADRTASGTAAASYQGALAVNVTNPKVALFVLAFFPQFVQTPGSVPLQLSILGLVYAGLTALYLGIVALFAGRVRARLLHSATTRRAVRYTSGSVLIAFGAILALEGPPLL